MGSRLFRHACGSPHRGLSWGNRPPGFARHGAGVLECERVANHLFPPWLLFRDPNTDGRFPSLKKGTAGRTEAGLVAAKAMALEWDLGGGGRCHPCCICASRRQHEALGVTCPPPLLPSPRWVQFPAGSLSGGGSALQTAAFWRPGREGGDGGGGRDLFLGCRDRREAGTCVCFTLPVQSQGKMNQLLRTEGFPGALS